MKRRSCAINKLNISSVLCCMFCFAKLKNRTSLKFSLGFRYSLISKAKDFIPNLGCVTSSQVCVQQGKVHGKLKGSATARRIQKEEINGKLRIALPIFRKEPSI